MKDSGAEICVSVTEDDPPGYGELPLVLQGRMVTIHDGGDFYIMRSAEMPHLREVHIGKEGSPAIVYIKKMETGSDSRESMEGRGVYEQKPVIRGSDNRYGFELPTPAESVFHAIRHAFLLKAQKLGMYVIHSASILYKGKAWLFSALSGVGKSTHADIWRRLYKTPYLNGDLNLLAFENGRLMVKGIPWCGTSGIFTTETYPLGGIILIARNERNYIEEPGEEAQIFGIQMRFISPKWDAEQTSESLDFAQRVAGMVRIARMHCNIEDEAAEVCRAWIDGSGDEE